MTVNGLEPLNDDGGPDYFNGDAHYANGYQHYFDGGPNSFNGGAHYANGYQYYFDGSAYY